jgi:hypothetical protein
MYVRMCIQACTLFADVIHNCLVLIRSLHIEISVKQLCKATAQIGTDVRVRVLNSGYWLEVSLHPEGPATGQLD